MTRAPRNRAEALRDLDEMARDLFDEFRLLFSSALSGSVGIIILLVALVAFVLDEVRLFWLRAQFGDYADVYDLSAARTKLARVRLIGNSVVPLVAEALVRANVGASEFAEVAS